MINYRVTLRDNYTGAIIQMIFSDKEFMNDKCITVLKVQEFLK